MPTYPVLDITIDDHLHLKQLEPTAADRLYELIDHNRERLGHRLFWVKSTHDVSVVERFIAAGTELQQTNGAPTAGIWYDNTLIGNISLHPINWETRAAVLGYWLDVNFEGQGIMTRCVRALCEFACGELSLDRLELVCAPDNMGTQAIARKLGFIRQPGSQEAMWHHDPGAQMVAFAKMAEQHTVGQV